MCTFSLSIQPLQYLNQLASNPLNSRTLQCLTVSDRAASKSFQKCCYTTYYYSTGTFPSVSVGFFVLFFAIGGLLDSVFVSECFLTCSSPTCSNGSICALSSATCDVICVGGWDHCAASRSGRGSPLHQYPVLSCCSGLLRAVRSVWQPIFSPHSCTMSQHS